MEIQARRRTEARQGQQGPTFRRQSFLRDEQGTAGQEIAQERRVGARRAGEQIRLNCARGIGHNVK